MTHTSIDKRQQGSTLLMATVILILLALMGCMGLQTVSQDQQVAHLQKRKKLSLYAAEAGIATALRILVTSAGTTIGALTLSDAAAHPSGQPRFIPDPTVTDANLILGYLDAGNFLGGKAPLDPALAEAAMEERVARPLGLSTVDAAHGVCRLVSTTIAEGIRLMSVQRGVDPRQFAILAFGGAAGLHVGQVARQLQVENVYIPAAAPVLSAYGMLSTDLNYDFSQSYPASLDRVDLNTVRSILEDLEAHGRDKLHAQGLGDDEIEVSRTADMRYLD